MKALQKFKDRNVMCYISPVSGFKFKRIEIKRYLHFHVHCSIIHNSQDVDTIYTSITDKENMKEKILMHYLSTFMLADSLSGHRILCRCSFALTFSLIL
jgi:hypothetical protein